VPSHSTSELIGLHVRLRASFSCPNTINFAECTSSTTSELSMRSSQRCEVGAPIVGASHYESALRDEQKYCTFQLALSQVSHLVATSDISAMYWAHCAESLFNYVSAETPPTRSEFPFHGAPCDGCHEGFLKLYTPQQAPMANPHAALGWNLPRMLPLLHYIMCQAPVNIWVSQQSQCSPRVTPYQVRTT
jgi:hypothetical protein